MTNIGMALLFLVVFVGVYIMLHDIVRQKNYWKQQAISAARKLMTVDEEQKKIRDAIDTAAANKIVEKDNRIIELEKENKFLRKANDQLWGQIRDLKAGGEFDG